MRGRIAAVLAVLSMVLGCDSGTGTGSKDMAMSLDGGDAGVCTAGAACALSGGGKGLCKAGACAACVDMTDDGACNTAYGSSSNPFICQSGACVAGCRTSTDCNGKICGLTTPNQCAACSTDAQCQMALGASICSNGTCVSSACTNTGSTCTANPADICCASGSGSACVAGTCCTNSDCGDAGKSCVNHTCTNCPSPSPGVLYVDPSETAGGAPTGANIAGCRFKTITTAMTVATAGTSIHVFGTKALTGTGTPCTDPTVECFPIAVTQGVSVVGDASQVPTIQVPASQPGFVLTAAGSSVSNVILDGLVNGTAAASYGINAPAPTPTPTPAPAIDHVTTQNFSSAGIFVNGGTLQINQGTVSTKNLRGLELNEFGQVTITGGASPISFDHNTNTGIRVVQGYLTVSGTPGANGSGSVVTNQNAIGLQIQQGSSPPFPNATLNGLVAWHNTADGVQVLAGSPTKINNSSFLGNGKSGLDIQPNNGLDIGMIEVGNNTGKNILQSTANPNAGAGICIEVGTSTRLPAQGNVFSAVDCSLSSGTVTTHSPCVNHVDVGMQLPSPTPTPTPPFPVDVTLCSQ